MLSSLCVSERACKEKGKKAQPKADTWKLKLKWIWNMFSL